MNEGDRLGRLLAEIEGGERTVEEVVWVSKGRVEHGDPDRLLDDEHVREMVSG